MAAQRTRKRLPPVRHYYLKLLRALIYSLCVVAVSLLVGMAGYHYFAGLNLVDSLLNASMILTGMGPVAPMITTGAKLFASFYALYSGIAFLTMMALLLAPVVHRFLHRFHLEMEEEE